MATTDDLQRRLDRARRDLVAAGHDALVASPGADLRYLCGHDVHLNERITALVIRAHDEPVLISPTLEKSNALHSPVGELGMEILAWGETDDPYAMIHRLIDGTSIVVSDRMWAQHVFALQSSAAHVAVGSGADLMAGLRSVKSSEEISSLRRAAHAIDSVHTAMDQWLRPGRTENDVAADLRSAILESGHATVDFVIVGSGANGASPHHEASDRVIAAGDMVVVDIGGTMPDGYCSDSTRTYLAGGSPTEEMTVIYDLLIRAQQAARDSVSAGVPAQKVDAVAREIITDGGYGERFIHRTGHGIGLETHEPPYLVAGNQSPLVAGTAFSVEPGIYLDGRFGARIEDIVVATESGADVLNQTARELRVVG